MGVEVKQNVPIERIQDLLVGAFEGGSNYWYLIEEQTKPTRFENTMDGKGRVWPCYDYPVNPGGSLKITTLENDEVNGKRHWLLHLDAISKGLKVMQEKYPKHFGDFMAENDDATTADVFLQCCLFGEIIFV